MLSFLKSMFGGGAQGGPSVAREKIAQGALVIDVRSAQEWQGGHLPNAKHLPVQELAARLEEVDGWCGGDRGRDIVVYCASGMRSGRARQMLAEAGFTSVINGGGYHGLA